MLIVRDPYSSAELAKLAWATRADAQAALARARKAFASWRTSSAWERSELLLAASRKLQARKNEFADLIRAEAGKPVTLARVEIDRAIGVLNWTAAEALRFSGEMIRLDASSSGRPGFGLNHRFPRGPVLGITPFNFPLNLVMHKIAPAIASGCPILVKPSPYTPLTALKTLELFEGMPEGLVQVCLADDALTAELTRADEIATISFTGSARVGRLVQQQAPTKPVILELGGNAWVIVLSDTDPSLYPKIAMRITGAAFGYAGQSCISVQNVAVEAGAWKPLLDALVSETKQVPFGDPALDSVISGPVINVAAARRLEAELVQSRKRAGAVLVDSSAGQSQNSVIPPTLVSLPAIGQNGQADSLTQEELFGPIMTARSFDALDAVIHQINSSRYGLQAGVFTQNWAAIEKLYRELDVGGLVVNDVPTTRYDHQPYGGVKESGFGREGARYAMEEMTEPKFLALSSTVQI